jgi:7-cyano-7-deazaguanine synthase
METAVKKCIVLLSGGLDSATLLAHVIEQGYIPFALSFSYGQKHGAETKAAAAIASLYGLEDHIIVDLDPRPFRASALTGGVDVPVNRSAEEMKIGLAPTYVPARNTIFLSYALAFGEELDIRDIFIGVNSVDYSGYPDCRAEFIAAFETLANAGTSAVYTHDAYRIHAPLQKLNKGEIIQMGVKLGVDYSRTVSCYQADGGGRACGVCDACQLRAEGFNQAGFPDPTPYVPDVHHP